MLSDVCPSVAYIGRNSRTERPRKTKIGTEVAHVTRDSDTTFKVKRLKGQGHQAALVGCTGRPTWTYSNGDLSICVDDVYRVTTCRPGRVHIVAAALLRLVFCALYEVFLQCGLYLGGRVVGRIQYLVEDFGHCSGFCAGRPVGD